ncbi:hypothetical protein T4B_10041 [Trichinella pseudospiralis]|uniref:Uncharacterized protein n=1 Tax=Trichinella pseudospiralis TaxID=6337 RepID=A0A0V1IDV9_TRIPS|nr:hypothetical protein T4B_10041 [Trichinella pseudospiralis]
MSNNRKCTVWKCKIKVQNMKKFNNSKIQSYVFLQSQFQPMNRRANGTKRWDGGCDRLGRSFMLLALQQLFIRKFSRPKTNRNQNCRQHSEAVKAEKY